jgi:hypothetical protein
MPHRRAIKKMLVKILKLNIYGPQGLDSTRCGEQAAKREILELEKIESCISSFKK